MQLAEPQILQAMDCLTQQYREMCQEAGVEATEEELQEPAEKLHRILKEKLKEPADILRQILKSNWIRSTSIR